LAAGGTMSSRSAGTSGGRAVSLSPSASAKATAHLRGNVAKRRLTAINRRHAAVQRNGDRLHGRSTRSSPSSFRRGTVRANFRRPRVTTSKSPRAAALKVAALLSPRSWPVCGQRGRVAGSSRQWACNAPTPCGRSRSRASSAALLRRSSDSRGAIGSGGLFIVGAEPLQ